MAKYNKEYYEPLEQMMAVRHQYMSKILRDHTDQDIYNFFQNKQVLDLGCGTGEFLNNYFEMGAQCTGIDIDCLLYTSPSPRDSRRSRMPSSA